MSTATLNCWHVLVTSIAVAALATACSGSSPIDPEVQPLVDAVQAAELPVHYAFTYLPTSPSPFLACLAGVDEVDAVLDGRVGAIQLRPRRDAPEIIITETDLLVAIPETDTWSSTPWNPGIDPATLTATFGETLAGFIITGVRSPDLNTTAVAAIGIAEQVNPAATPPGASGQSFEIVMDPQRFAAELAAEADKDNDTGDTASAPELVVSVNPVGQVTAIVVSDGDATDEATNYAIAATYQQVPELVLPPPPLRIRRPLAGIEYPEPAASCVFGG